MARKSNKTAHVLNLLAGGSNTEAQEDQVKTEQPKKNTSNISLIDPAVTSDPLSSLIRESLDKEIIDNDSTEAHQEEPAAVLADDSHMASEAEKETEKETAIPTEPEEKALEEKQLSEQERIEQVLAHISEDMSSESEPLPEPSPEPAPAEAKPEVTPKDIIKEPEFTDEIIPDQAAVGTVDTTPAAPVEKAVKKEITPSNSTSAAQTAEYDYKYINIMDIVVDERLMEFVKRFGVCTCDRCVKDTKALAMSNLPAKYIVSPVASVPPLLSFYKNKYNIYVITELTKACLAVLDNPRH